APRADAARAAGAPGTEPRPPCPAGLDLALVGAIALVAAEADRSGLDGGLRGRLAGEPHRRRLLGLRPHGVAPADELEVAVHLLGGPVAIGGLLREGANHAQVPRVRDV